MSYIVTTIGTIVRQKELERKQEKLLADIRKIVGHKKFYFSDAYLKKYPRHTTATIPFTRTVLTS